MSNSVECLTEVKGNYGNIWIGNKEVRDCVKEMDYGCCWLTPVGRKAYWSVNDRLGGGAKKHG